MVIVECSVPLSVKRTYVQIDVPKGRMARKIGWHERSKEKGRMAQEGE